MELVHPILALLPLAPLVGALLVYIRPTPSNDAIESDGSVTGHGHSGDDHHSHDDVHAAHSDHGHGTVHAPQERVSGWIATLFSCAAFTVTLFCTALLFGSKSDAVTFSFGNWFTVDALQVTFGLRFDALSSVMCLVITGVGTLIHMYAIGYMYEDPDQKRFFAYLNLFLFSMLTLVLGDNLLLMFVGWEGVGLCSYLLIGFWFKEMPNAQAGQKAFVVNRIGDAGFLIGIFTLFLATQTVNFQDLIGAVSALPPGVIELAAFALFIGAMGKSAQIPLYVWLPDAMAGPTPVSALIHAATMVTAGVYMTTRLAPLFAAAPHASAFILVIGAMTALLAATIALVQTDIKKVLAYSTVSQLGYMFMAVGSYAYSNGLFHVVTHAFFKACLFMAAGSVIIGCHHEQDMRKFGGLRKYMPWTFGTYFVATLAIAGFPFLSGFFSKDLILWSVFSQQGFAAETKIGGVALSHLAWGVGLFTALLTAFYMTRSLILTFFGDYKGHAHPHESPWVVTVPLVILAALSAGFGFFYGERLLHVLHAWTRSDIAVGHEVLAANHTYHLLEMISIGVALSGIALAVLFYSVRPVLAQQLQRLLPQFHQALSAKWWVDELYEAVIIRPLRFVAQALFLVVDRTFIDGTVNGTAVVVEASGDIVHRASSGLLSHYVVAMFIGLVFFLVFLFLM